MDPGGSELESSLPQHEKPCLIVEDSQPDSVALEDDPETSYRAVLARRLSNLQPTSRSPVLELISPPASGRSAQTDSQSEASQRDSQAHPGAIMSADPSSSLQEESQVISVCSPPSRTRCAAEDAAMTSGADSTTHCVQSEEGTSQFGVLQLSQSQDLHGNSGISQKEEAPPTRSGQQTVHRMMKSQDVRADSFVDSQSKLGVQEDHGFLSSQEDLFDADRTGVTVDSTVSEEEQQGDPTPTPAHTLGLLHLSGQRTLVQESLSQSSVDYVAPTPDPSSPTPLIVPSSPTESESDIAIEPMDTLAPPEGQRENREEATSKRRPSASTPVSQNSPGLMTERTLSVPSQPEFSHDVFVPTQSQESLPRSDKGDQSQRMDSGALCLQLSVNTLSAEDSQDTQIDDIIGPLDADTSDSGGERQRERHVVSSQSGSKSDSEPLKQSSQQPHPPVAPGALNLTSLNVKHTDSSQATPPGPSSCLISQREWRSPDHINSQMLEGKEPSTGGGASGIALVLSQSQTDDIIKHSHNSCSQPIRGREVVSTNGNHSKKPFFDRLCQPETAGPEPDKSLSDSSGEISFHFTLPKEDELIGPVVGATPPLVSQLKQTLRHSTPIEAANVSAEAAADVSVDAAMVASDASSGESGGEKGEGKLSLRMKLVTPVEEGSSERFSLQKPALSEEEGGGVRVSCVHSNVNSPSVFSRVNQVHRQHESENNALDEGNGSPARGELFSPQTNSQVSLGCKSLLTSQVEQPSQEEVFAAPRVSQGCAGQAESEDRLGRTEPPQTPPIRGPRALAGRGEPASPSLKRTSAPAHRRHVRTIQEVRTTVTRIITDVYYEDGREVDRKVTQEREEPVVDCQVLDSDISPCRTGSSSVTSGDLADISSLSSKASSLQHSSGGTSGSSGFIRTDFILPPSRGGRSFSPRRGHRGHRGQRGQRAGSALTADTGTPGPRALSSPTSRGRARRGRPPSRSTLSRGGGASSLQRLSAHAQMVSSSEDEPYTRMLPPRIPVSPSDPSSSRSESLCSSPEEAGSAGSSFVGLRVVAKWSSNGYFYSGRIIQDAGDSKFRLRFDDGYECEVAGKDILLCDPIPMETEVTALLEDQYFSVGVVKDHKTEGEELWYSVEKDGQRQWYSRTSIILSLEQGNKLREQHSLGPYTPSTPLTKASDISLDNLVEGKRRRRGGIGGNSTPHCSTTSSPRTPGPSGKRKLLSSEEGRTPSKRGRRGGGARAGQLTGVCNTSGSGTDLPGRSSDDVTETHGPLPLNASLFQGFAFMLTASSETDRLTNKNSSEDEEDYVQTGPYNKKYTESQLQTGGGFILPDFNEEQCKAAYQSLLIADQHCRTRKYLLCVASGVPCVSHMWVRDCCKENKLLNYRNYLLPAGAGPDGTIVEWHPHRSPFRSLRVLLVFEQQVDLWTQLVSLGGGSSVKHDHNDDSATADASLGKFDIVVTDSACPPLVQKSVKSQDVPLVSAEWLIQSVIRGEQLGFRSDPQYHHDYSSS